MGFDLVWFKTSKETGLERGPVNLERHSLHGIVKTEVDRPDKKVIEGFAKHDAAKVGDAMAGSGIMNYEIKPISEGMRVAGPAVTVLTRPGDALFIQKVADIAQPGDVIVVDAGGVKDVSCIGERIAGYMHRRGIAGFVVDGAVRDVKGIREFAFPTWCRAITPRIFGSVGPGAINVPIQCGGVAVNPGDIIVADDDGVVVVPHADAARVLELSNEHLKGELERVERAESGETLTEIFGIEAKIARWQEDNT